LFVERRQYLIPYTSLNWHMRPINMLVVHSSATDGSKDFSAAHVDRWHREQGWDAIGYHYVIGLTGRVEIGRPETRTGAHAVGFNALSIGICLIGGLDANGRPSATFTTAQYASLERLLLELRSRFPKAQILGHRDLPKVKKDCPCFDVRTWCSNRGIAPTV
jgi:N-acetylmuramoyl-L-alanine amidase